MNVLPNVVSIAVMISMVTLAAAQPGEQVSIAHVENGELAVTFRDNSQSPQVLSGVDSLYNTKHAADYDAFDPAGRGASAGLNFEHIISGHENANNSFTPRHGRYLLHKQSDGRSVLLVRRAEDCPWKVASTMEYVVRDPYYIDFTFRCQPQDASLFGNRGYAVFFFANYMNDVEDVAIHFRGRESPQAEETWIAADAPPGPRDWNSGGNYRALKGDELKYDDNVRFRLNTWTYDWPRIAQPFYYGRAGRGMTMILMFDRLRTDRDQMRFSLYKFKLPKHPRPAWDFQYVINKVEPGAEYGFRGRLVWKRFLSADDCWSEYARWAALLRARSGS